jgi:hypothetical protein
MVLSKVKRLPHCWYREERSPPAAAEARITILLVPLDRRNARFAIRRGVGVFGAVRS